MAKKHKHPEHENLERWLVSYADFITLLFATFTALYAIATADLAKLKNVGQSISDGFKKQSLMNGVASILQGKSAPNDNPKPISSEKGQGPSVLGKNEERSEGEVVIIRPIFDMVKKLESQVESINKDLKAEMPEIKDIKVSVEDRGVRISMDARMLFASGTAILSGNKLLPLDKIIQKLKPLANRFPIEVEGHTDSQPILSALYPSNWELSTARACSVVRYLASKHHIAANKLIASGYADSRPIADNTTLDGRAKNRRIDLIMLTMNSLAGSTTSKSIPAHKTAEESSSNALQPIRVETTEALVKASSETPAGLTPIKIESLDKHP